ncbi:Eco57I restriction-modification methylase domain-containing protein [Patescibacteria group bacterium]|nr:Eco57I restriction-modification methylase domain-containing protein [Patescibacteria group bacterium]
MPKEILRELVENFRISKLQRFFEEKTKFFAEAEEELTQYRNEQFSVFLKIGEIKLELEPVIIIAVKTKSNLSEHSSKKAQYEIAKKILKQEDKYPAGIFVFYDEAGSFRFSLIHTETFGTKLKFSNFRRFTYFVSPGQTNKTFLNRIGAESFDSLKDIKEAFSVQKVTKEFFDGYIALFNKIKTVLNSQNIADNKICHNFILNLLNRLMFLYFVQKKEWLGDNKKFLQYFWRLYKNEKNNNSFYKDWLQVLFLEAFNNKFLPKKYFSKELNDILQFAPYLNGGLFKKRDLDTYGFKINDNIFEEIFEFFDSYNFTIEENSEDDADLEIDPKLIGDVYESLVNTSEDDDEQSNRGIFYTDRTEINFMVKLSLADYFSNHLENKTSWVKYFFGNDEEKNEAVKEADKLKLWPEIKNKIENLSLADPACGSGSFLVGALEVLSKLYKISLEKLGEYKNDYEIKKHIISYCLYGVDVKEWAVHIAELRLWLQLIIDAELSESQRTLTPLLPNLTLKLRVGDSLVQELGGINLSLRSKHLGAEIPSAIKAKITNLKKEKIKYTNNDSTCKYKSENLLKQEELNIYNLIIEHKIKALQNKNVALENYAKQKTAKFNLFGEKTEDREITLFAKSSKDDIQKNKAQIEKLREIRKTLKDKKPFVWDIDFVEVFSDENENGFDVVIGNPPYVRQEKIADPQLTPKEINNENKREYKEKLFRAINFHFPFIKKIDKKSDLYIYFYFLGLALLNSRGTFCFVTSNSWLDVGYGKDLQEFLLKNVKIKGIFDNQVKRSFANADVNTVISLFSAPQHKKEKENLENIAKFVMFKKQFKHSINADNILKIENIKEIESYEDFRVYTIGQNNLLEEGMEYENEEQKKLNAGKYTGNKWGGKYLRAPDIYFRILEKGKGKLLNLGAMSSIIKRNNLENFKEWKIKTQHYNHNSNFFPFLHSLKDTESININIDNLKSFEKNKKNKKIEYIKPDIISNRFVGERIFFIEGGDFLINDSFFISKLKDGFNKKITTMSINSTLSLLSAEVIGRKTYATGVMYIYGPEFKKLLLINPNLVEKNKILNIYNNFTKRKINSIFTECGFDKNKPIREQEPKPLPDRKKLDDIIFDILGLTKEERKEVYWAVCELVKNRLDKAKSV